MFISLYSLGINIAFSQIYPIKQKATLLNSLMINSLTLLLTTPAILHLLSLLFRDNMYFTAAYHFLQQFEEGRYMKLAMEYGVLPIGYLFFIIVSVVTLGVCWLFWRRRMKVTPRIIHPHDSQEECKLYVEWNQLLRLVHVEENR